MRHVGHIFKNPVCKYAYNANTTGELTDYGLELLIVEANSLKATNLPPSMETTFDRKVD